jgi:hypothetical protein
MLPIYDRQGRILGFVKETRTLVLKLPNGAQLFKPGQLLRVEDVDESNAVFTVIEEP